ncbi:uncharacterized protein DS421_12g375060 [Arachis hypogaea]|nr:uncharacterized protein DS421_12g375060 [Arachis hypogaea]
MLICFFGSLSYVLHLLLLHRCIVILLPQFKSNFFTPKVTQSLLVAYSFWPYGCVLVIYK